MGGTGHHFWRGLALAPGHFNAGIAEPVVRRATSYTTADAVFHIAVGQHGVYRPCGDAWWGLGALHRFNHALHLLAAGYWFGSLLPLMVCLRYLAQPQWRSDAVTTLIRFSRWGHLAVALVLLTGVINSLIILGSWPLDVDSPYQRLLLFKTALVALMVMVALANRYAVVPAMSSMPRLAQRGLVLACWAELGLGAVVLLLVSLFATYAPV